MLKHWSVKDLQNFCFVCKIVCQWGMTYCCVMSESAALLTFFS